MKVAQSCRRHVVTGKPDDDVHTLAVKMREYHVGSLVVVEEVEGRQRPVGIVTDRDLVVLVLARGAEADTDKLTAADLMADPLVTVLADASMLHALNLMQDAGVRRLPVIDDDGYLFGVIALDDAIGALVGHMRLLAQIAGVEQRNEWIRRR